MPVAAPGAAAARLAALCSALVCLAALCGAPAARAQVLGDVFIYTDNYTFDPFPDLPADFGPEVPPEGIDGLLLVADPVDACEPLTFSVTDEPWVALISRSQHLRPTNCTFDVKVRHAEAAGACAAIVHDDTLEPLLIMSAPRDHPEPGIPSVFVSEKAGLIMRKLITPGETRVRIVPVSGSAWMSLVMSAFLGFLALTVVLATFYVMRSWSVWLGRTRGRRLPAELGRAGAYPGGQAPAPSGLPACAIRALPVLIYEGKAGRRHQSSPRAPHAPVSQSAPAAAGPWEPPLADEQQQQQQQPGAGPAPPQPPRAIIGAVFFASPATGPATPAAGAGLADAHDIALGGGSSSGSGGGPAGLLLAPPLAATAAEPLPSPGRSDASSALLSTDDDEPEPAAAAGPAAASAPGSGSGARSAAAAARGLIVTGGPVGARGGATRRTCVVCLERYHTGDKVRVLPCQHRFHARCIDPWLSNRRLCPVCKHDASALPPAQLQMQLQQSGFAAAGGGGGAAVPAAAAEGAAPPPPGSDAAAAAAAGGGGGGLLLQGFWRLGSRLARAGRGHQQRQQAAEAAAEGLPPGGAAEAATSAAAGTAAHPGAAAAQRQLRTASAYAAAVAAADAAEAGLLVRPPAAPLAAGVLPAPLPQQQQQQQQQQQAWRQRQRQQRQQRQLVMQPPDGLMVPLLPGPSTSAGRLGGGGGGGSGGRGGLRAAAGSRAIPQPASGSRVVFGRGAPSVLPASPPMPIPQLTPIHSDADASSVGSAATQTPTPGPALR